MQIKRLLAWPWNFLAIVFAALWPTRVALALILAGFLLFYLNDQGQDIAIRLVENDASWGAWIIFSLAVFWWALQSWLWSRIALDMQFRDQLDHGSDPVPQLPPTLCIHNFDGVVDSKVLAWLVGVVPRFYAFLVFALAAAAIWHVGGAAKPAVWLFFAAGAVLTVVLWKRRAWLDPLSSKKKGFRGTVATMVARDTKPAEELVLGATPAARFLTVLALALSIVLAIAVWSCTQAVGTALGAASGTFLAFASMLALLGLASVFSHRWHVPVVASLLIASGIAALVAPWLYKDPHTIPVVTTSPEQQRTIDRAIKDWRAANPAAPSGRTPMVFVATAGGGVRAALWTAVVLDRARQVDPKFDQRLFALSGVSGGALGATAYLAALSSGAAGKAEACKSQDGVCTFGNVARKMFMADMLGPTLEASFYGDLLFTFVPFPTPMTSADALTETWRVAWDDAVRDTKPDAVGAFSQPFLDHWKGKDWRPVVMLNGTHVESGKRLITSNLLLSGTSIRDAWDLYTLLQGGDISTAMAALNAARFPGVVAAGTVPTKTKDGGPTSWGHVIDGGYFENSGALGLVELAGDVSRLAPPNGAPPPKDTPSLNAQTDLTPIFIEIVSDTDLIARDYLRTASLAECNGVAEPDKDGRQRCATVPPLPLLIGLTGPANGILNVRSGHGIWTPRDFADAATALFVDENAKTKHIQFRLCPADGDTPVPLGWQLSQASAEDIVASLPAGALRPEPSVEPAVKKKRPYQRWLCQKDNADALKQLHDALNGVQ